ncbi:MBL fold metallo-hydrolase [Yoonia vestfoldensis]|uniref:Metallo-beta-lactamase L1 type 3 n=1 Tax=Yoonia vestfoldensis TaxID=245188 RepID=A0A1Y0EC36_9RHOB|nr:MBL fold metallo-hydrolase [Yoonia vestfoldensis]ARU01165.1 metallo-beta-lactamase L1 type 3 [Yoonia vestfoldensis]
MIRRGIAPFVAACLAAAPLQAQDMAEAEAQARIGLAAAADFPGYASLCDLQARIRDVNAPRAPRPATATGAAQQQRQGNAPQPIPPTQLFDNLWVLGTESVTAFLYGTPAGYILIDGLNTDAEAQKFVFDGLTAVGIDPRAITAVLVTHGHGDHYGGADLVAERLGIDVLMTQEDWDLVASLGTHPRFGPPPQPGGTVTDGQVLRFGESTLRIFVTPGHTPGTISPILDLRDGDSVHRALLWGGTGFNFGRFPGIFRQYAASARRAGALADAEGVDVLLSAHPRRDGTLDKLAALASRAPGAPHPFVAGDSGHALFTVLEHCALAQAARITAAVQSDKQNP